MLDNPATECAPSLESGARPLVLVIDDDAAVLDSIRLSLEVSGFDVITACNGVEGVAAFRSCRPALVLTDIIMPGEDGLGVIREIHREHPDAKIVVISGGGRLLNHDYLGYGVKLGADASIEKPFDMEHLREVLQSILAGIEPPALEPAG